MMQKQFTVGSRTFEWASKELGEAFFATISYRLEPGGKGTRFPILLGELSQGKLTPAQAPQALKELEQITPELKELPKEKVVAHLASLARLDDRNLIVNRNAQNVYDYFITPNQNSMVSVLKEALLATQMEQKPLIEKLGGVPRYLRDYLSAAALLLMGVGFMVWEWHSATTEGYVHEKSVVFGPVSALIGLVGFFYTPILRPSYVGGIVNQKLLIPQMIVLGIGIGLGFYYRHILLHGW